MSIKFRSSLVLFAVLMTGCAMAAPYGPSVMVLPARGEDFATFQQHDTTCREFAASRMEDGSLEDSARRSGAGGALAGAGVGAAAGALLGSASGHAGSGAAIGAGGGLLAGLLFGSSRGHHAAETLQHRYDMAYTQCMLANGERLPPDDPPPREIVYLPPPPPPVVYAPPPPVIYAPPPVYVAPRRVIIEP